MKRLIVLLLYGALALGFVFRIGLAVGVITDVPSIRWRPFLFGLVAEQRVFHAEHSLFRMARLKPKP